MARQTSDREELMDRLIELAHQTIIVHHIPGRIRLRVKLSGLLLAQQMEVADLVSRFEGILEARANLAARSIVFTYDPATITPALWEQLVNRNKDPSTQNSVKKELGRLFRPDAACAGK